VATRIGFITHELTEDNETGRSTASLPRWEGVRVLVLGHVATRWALEHFLVGADLAELAPAEFVWQEGWEYRLEPTPTAREHNDHRYG
jgi:alpha-ribazole phosphatase/probable phosphoglycerate mutase